MSLTKFILFKYLKFDKTQPFISVAGILAFLGIAIGIMVLLVAMAIMNGMLKEFHRQLFIMNHPINIISLQKDSLDEATLKHLEEKFPTFAFSPYLRSQAIIRNGGKFQGVLLFGIDFAKESAQNKILKDAISQIPLNLLETRFPIILGSDLNYQLNASDKINVFFTRLEPIGINLSPISKRFNVIGEFSSGIRAYDLGYAFTDINSLLAIRGEIAPTFDGIYVSSPDPMNDISSLKNELSDKHLAFEGYWHQNATFFSALELEKRALFIVLMLIILMASLNIISSLLMVIMNRRKEIALLMSFGASQNEIKKIFFTLGFIIGFSGIIFGLILSGIAFWALSEFDIISLPPEVYGISKLPLDLSLLDFFGAFFGACIIVAFAAFYPAQKASKIDPLKVLRSE
ncbi:MAG: ABC transporter permease [Helicobacter sp.]|nr:ABC transporter permease [Helicobacter sp.]